MGIEIVLDENDAFGSRKVDIGQVLEDVGIIDCGPPIGNLYVAPPFQGREQHEEIGRAVAFVLVVEPGGLSRFHRHRNPGFGDQLLGCLIEADQRPSRITRAGIDRQHILHRRHEGAVGIGRDDPLLFQVRLKFVFLSVRATVLALTSPTMFSATS